MCRRAVAAAGGVGGGGGGEDSNFGPGLVLAEISQWNSITLKFILIFLCRP